MFKRVCFLIAVLLFITVSSQAQNYNTKPVRFGASVGFGLPKIEISHFRTPVSLLGGVMLRVHLFGRFGIQVNGYGLYTISLGSVTEDKGKLRFNVSWVSSDLVYQLRGGLHRESFLSAGGGYYKLHQQFDQRIENYKTPGIGIGLLTCYHRRRLGTMLELRWHLLFEPKSNPQILTITYGILI